MCKKRIHYTNKEYDDVVSLLSTHTRKEIAKKLNIKRYKVKRIYKLYCQREIDKIYEHNAFSPLLIDKKISMFFSDKIFDHS